ncbi:MAG: KdsC family phosphatase [Acidimicrobiales bacterium]
MSLSGRDVELVVMDFDGVLTDNAVWIAEDGAELVRCDRSDGLGIERLLAAGYSVVVLSSERNPVVTARCRKLGLPVHQGVRDKLGALASLLEERRVDRRSVLYVGNDVNDAECLRLAGIAVVVADAHPAVVPLADVVLTNRGGHGAVRELSDLLTSEAQVASATGASAR